VQVQATDSKADADATAARAASWWSEVAPEDGEADVLVVWQAPYYRVRLGPFASRADAQRALDRLRERFPNAFLVPATASG
jgi:cell division septation protein DedD